MGVAATLPELSDGLYLHGGKCNNSGILPGEVKLFIDNCGGSRPSHEVSGTWSRFPKLNESRQQYDFYKVLFNSEPGQNFVWSATG